MPGRHRASEVVVRSRYRLRVTRYRIHVKPGSRKAPLVHVGQDGLLTVFVRERAVDGAANEGVRAVLAAHFGVRKSDVRVVSGHVARIKTVEIDD